MAMLQPITCVFCGKTEHGFNGPVEPADPNRQPQENPPGSGYYYISGPSFGLGFPEPKHFCSREHMNRYLDGEPPTATQEDREVVVRGWKSARPESGRPEFVDPGRPGE